jgi:hypothetical protein
MKTMNIESEKAMRKVLKDLDMTTLDCVKILSHALTLMIAEYMNTKNFDEKEFIDYMTKNHDINGCCIPVLGLSLIYKLQHEIMKIEVKK